MCKSNKNFWSEIVTVAVRRVNITDKNKPLLMDYLDPKKLHIYLIQQDALILRKL